jgi:hypothetical protein
MHVMDGSPSSLARSGRKDEAYWRTRWRSAAESRIIESVASARRSDALASRAAWCALASLATLLVAPPAFAEGRFGPYDIRTLFAIDKSNDRNRVEYGIRLDKDCVPAGSEPVYAYWRQYERGPEVTDDLNFGDRTVYGIKDQHVDVQPGGGTRVVIRLRATSSRSIGIYVRKERGVCVADSMTFIAGTPARLNLIHVELAGFLSVRWIELRGQRTDSGQPIVERVKL